uniref:Uncharacterized protein n=1 Tax=Plectus sambesii TaxID=2011161 RepID=A0A914WQS4_9BILA
MDRMSQPARIHGGLKRAHKPLSVVANIYRRRRGQRGSLAYAQARQGFRLIFAQLPVNARLVPPVSSYVSPSSTNFGASKFSNSVPPDAVVRSNDLTVRRFSPSQLSKHKYNMACTTVNKRDEISPDGLDPLGSGAPALN